MSTELSIKSIKTTIFKLDDDLVDFIIKSLNTPIAEKSILAITSKIVSLAEGRALASFGVDKAELIKKESDLYLGDIGYGCHLTIKHGLLIPSAGIDESNSDKEHYILYPVDPFKSAYHIWKSLREHYKLSKLGIILTDSKTTPLRKGVTGISLAHWGFEGVRNMIGTPDIFGRELKMTQINVADALACAAVYVMGEGSEQTPLALLKSDGIKFVNENRSDECAMPYEQDLYRPMLEPWIKK